MSKQARRIAMSLAALTLLASLFLAVQPFLDPPDEALAACEVQISCWPWVTITSGYCCCGSERLELCGCQRCTKINLDCSVTQYWNCPYCWCDYRYFCRCV